MENCHWTETDLSRLNALPEKGKPLNTWSRASDGMFSIGNGLATVFKKRKTQGSKKGG